MSRNLATSLKRRSRSPAMARYDRLPPDLRRWLAEAAMPWSPCSVQRLWSRLHRDCAGDTDAVRQRMSDAEARMLARDAPKIWGATYPGETASSERP